MVFQYGTGDLQFALCKLCFTLVDCNTDDMQFVLWKLHYMLLQ
jgi:hypothetical protein